MICAYLHWGADQKCLEKRKWSSGLSIHFAIYGYSGNVVIVS